MRTLYLFMYVWKPYSHTHYTSRFNSFATSHESYWQINKQKISEAIAKPTRKYSNHNLARNTQPCLEISPPQGRKATGAGKQNHTRCATVITAGVAPPMRNRHATSNNSLHRAWPGLGSLRKPEMAGVTKNNSNDNKNRIIYKNTMRSS